MALMFSSTPLFQAWYVHDSGSQECRSALPCSPLCCVIGDGASVTLRHHWTVTLAPCSPTCLCSLSVGIIFTSYALQVRFQPFLPPNNDMLDNNAALLSGMKMVYVSDRGLASVAAWVVNAISPLLIVLVIAVVYRPSTTTRWRRCTSLLPCSFFWRVCAPHLPRSHACVMVWQLVHPRT